jgi:hypothetical protein
MKLDTRQTFHQIHHGNGKKFTEALLEISEHTVSADEAAVWAQNLRFIAVPKEFNFRAASQKTAVTVTKKEEETDSLHTASANDIYHGCVCDPWPKFPPQELPYLALTHIGEVQNCNHHVAVSYCWSRVNSGSHESSTKATLAVSNLDGRELRPSKRQRLSPRPVSSSIKGPYDIMTGRGMRKGRVPRDVMDRALRYAANKGLSFIWIDQECIEQDDPVEKELAIQSMHLVYRRSEFPLGLLTTELVRQQHIDALNFAIRYSCGDSLLRDADAKSEGFSGIPGRERPIHSFIRNLAEVLKIMAHDKWLTRGWIMQEMVLAGEKMVFSMPCDTSLTKPDWGGDIDGELHFTLDQLVPIFDDVLSSDAKAREFDEFIPTMDKRLNVGQAFYASYRKLRHITLGTSADGDKSMSGHYRVCNPLAAVLYLEGRSNSRHGDRLAIVGNLCDYAVRLNSTTLEKLRFGYSTCLLALMLLNGDITYVVEWAKSLAQQKNDWGTAKLPHSLLDLKWDPPVAYSWMPGPYDSLSLGLTYGQFIDNGNLALATIMDPIMQVHDPRLSNHGFHLHGWTWNVSQELDLPDFQRTLKKSWPSILEKAEHLDDFASLAAPVAKLVLDLFSAMLRAEVRDLTLLLWHHLVLNYLGDWSETDGDLSMNSRLPKALVPSLSQLGRILIELTALYDYPGKNSLSPHLILRLLMIRLKEGSTAPPELEWTFNFIMNHGCIRWGRPSSPPGSASYEGQNRAIAVFECAAKDLILTPQMRDPTKDTTERRLWMRHFRQQPGSWIIESQDTTPVADNNVPIFKTKGMVRGLWRIGDIKSNSYIIS